MPSSDSVLFANITPATPPTTIDDAVYTQSSRQSGVAAATAAVPLSRLQAERKAYFDQAWKQDRERIAKFPNLDVAEPDSSSDADDDHGDQTESSNGDHQGQHRHRRPPGPKTTTSPLITAIRNGDRQLIANAFAQDIDENDPTPRISTSGVIDSELPSGKHPIHLAAILGQELTLACLLISGVPIDCRDRMGRTPLMLAIAARKQASIDFLLKHGADVSLEDENGWHALHYAAAMDLGLLSNKIVHLSPHRQILRTPTNHTASMYGQYADDIANECGNRSLGRRLKDMRLSAGDIGRWYTAGYYKHRIARFFDPIVGRPFCTFLQAYFFVLGAIVYAHAHFATHATEVALEDASLFHILDEDTGTPLQATWRTRFWQLYNAFYIIVLAWMIFFPFLDPGTILPVVILPRGRDSRVAAGARMKRGQVRRTIGATKVNSYVHAFRQIVMLEGMSSVCVTCQVQRKERSKHCKVCGVCVDKMDHHCPWVNRCVGSKNQKLFILFVFCMCVGAVNHVLVLGTHIWATEGSGGARKNLLNLYFMFHSVLIIAMTGTLLSTQLYNVSKNITTNEYINQLRYDYLKDDRGFFYNPHDKGKVKNCLNFWEVPAFVQRCVLSTVNARAGTSKKKSHLHGVYTTNGLPSRPNGGAHQHHSEEQYVRSLPLQGVVVSSGGTRIRYSQKTAAAQHANMALG